MSAWIVSKEHIDYLITAGLSLDQFGVSWRVGPNRVKLTLENATQIGRLLWIENLKSVACRYPDDKGNGDRPGYGDQDDTIEQYRYARSRNAVSVVQALKAIHCYEYQSCEHRQWERSQAKRFCTSLESSLVRNVPGYDEATWGVDEPEVAASTNGRKS